MRKTLLLYLLILTTEVPPASSQENLIRNGDFPVNVAWWGGNNVQISWDARNAGPPLETGSMRLIPLYYTGDAFPAVTGQIVPGCVSGATPSSYVFDADVAYFESRNSSEYRRVELLACWVAPSADGPCRGSWYDCRASSLWTSNGMWHTLRARITSEFLPGSFDLLVKVFVYTYPDRPATAVVDNVRLIRGFISDFETADLYDWSYRSW